MADEVTAVDLLKADLYLFLEPPVVGQQVLDGFLHQLAGLPTGMCREPVQCGFLLGSEMDFHPLTVEAAASSVKYRTALPPRRAFRGALAQFLQPSLDMGRALAGTLGGAPQHVVQLREPAMRVGSGPK